MRSECGPACKCTAPSGGNRVKTLVSVVVLLAVVGILVYKVTNSLQTASSDDANLRSSTFSVAPTAVNGFPGVDTQSVHVTDRSETVAPKADDPAVENAPAVEAAPVGRRIGETLESLDSLNSVALNRDAVFVFIPASDTTPADDKTVTAVDAVRQTLESNRIVLGLYTLSTGSPDYHGISARVQAPAILVACKGRGMVAVDGEMTENKLLQAFMAASGAAGCGTSKCSSSGPACPSTGKE